MAGLSIVLEAQKSGGGGGSASKKTPQVINKATMIINKFPSRPSSCSSSSFQVLPFLQQCFLCGQKLLPGKDIYMYKGDRGFCSVECRYRQIFMDEEDILRIENCSLAAMKPSSAAVAVANNSSSSSSSSNSRHRKNIRNRAGDFAY